MTEELESLKESLMAGRLSRREFLGRASALGFGAAAASMMPGLALAADKPIKGGHLKTGFAGGGSADSLDPTLATSDACFLNLRLFGETLVNTSASGQLEYRIAEEASSSDGVTWLFKIRNGVEFHNGKTLTAEDVVETIRRHSDEKSQSIAKGGLSQIDRLSTEGNTVKISLKGANADFPFALSEIPLSIQPNGGKGDPASGIGSGPYKLEGTPQAGVRYQFRKFANYWDPAIGHVEENEVLIINDATARTGALQSGQVHMINLVDPKIVGRLKSAPGISVKNVTGRSHYVFSMRTDTAPFDNEDLRMALKLAIDRDEIVKKVLAGFGSVGNDMPINANYPFFDASIPQRRYDPEQAAAYYKKSGHDGSPIVLHVSDAVFSGATDAAQLFQQSAAKAGIPISVQREPGDGYYTEVWSKKPFFVSLWAGRATQDQVYSLTYLSTAPWNETHLKNAELDRLVLAARSELDPSKRQKLYSDVANLLRDHGGTIAFAFNDFIDAVSNKLGGYNPDPNRALMNLMAPIKCWLPA
ncbi:ABC transporter substrate-binding protein [Mesorhizobium sp. M0051]|uniref:ABC transporter substrate-binding protein n=1 Tax=Mesorhizobium sp. M0051 TaxID=2956862 RepID=UPI003339C668